MFKIIEDMLKKELQTYNKGSLNFNDFKNNIETAVTNAQKSILRYQSDDNDNPVTYMGHFYAEIKKAI